MIVDTAERRFGVAIAVDSANRHRVYDARAVLFADMRDAAMKYLPVEVA